MTTYSLRDSTPPESSTSSTASCVGCLLRACQSSCSTPQFHAVAVSRYLRIDGFDTRRPQRVQGSGDNKHWDESPPRLLLTYTFPWLCNSEQHKTLMLLPRQIYEQCQAVVQCLINSHIVELEAYSLSTTVCCQNSSISVEGKRYCVCYIKATRKRALLQEPWI